MSIQRSLIECKYMYMYCEFLSAVHSLVKLGRVFLVITPMIACLDKLFFLGVEVDPDVGNSEFGIRLDHIEGA